MRRSLLLVALTCGLVGPGRAQDAGAFDRAHAAATSPGATAAACRRAADAFLAMPDGPERRARVLEGVEVMLLADRLDLAEDGLDEARRAGMANGRLAGLAVRAAVRRGPVAAAVAVARIWVERYPDDVRMAMLAEESALASAAERALRSGELASGRFVFEQLAAAPPLAAYRVANYALCLRQLGDHDGARRQYDLAMALAPTDLEIANDFGLFLRGTGDVAGAVGAFRRAWQLDLARASAQRGRGPAITNLVMLEAVRPGVAAGDPLQEAELALALRPDAVLLRRVALDVAVARARR